LAQETLLMLLVDTTVWIDFFASRELPHVRLLEDALLQDDDICICGVILTEVLQGIRDDKDYRKITKRFQSLVFLPMTPETFILSADIYRLLRKKGITIRNAVDCMIAAVAIEHRVPLLHNDRDYEPITQHCGLQTASGTEDNKAMNADK
jgi:predicted nucleic acid-binding protein